MLKWSPLSYLPRCHPRRVSRAASRTEDEPGALVRLDYALGTATAIAVFGFLGMFILYALIVRP